jgi:outer membrane protein assembly factor BamA
VEAGAVLTDGLVAQTARQLQQRYRLAGYRATRVASESAPRQDPTTVDLVYRVTRGERLGSAHWRFRVPRGRSGS